MSCRPSRNIPGIDAYCRPLGRDNNTSVTHLHLSLTVSTKIVEIQTRSIDSMPTAGSSCPVKRSPDRIAKMHFSRSTLRTVEKLA